MSVNYKKVPDWRLTPTTFLFLYTRDLRLAFFKLAFVLLVTGLLTQLSNTGHTVRARVYVKSNSNKRLAVPLLWSTKRPS